MSETHINSQSCPGCIQNASDRDSSHVALIALRYLTPDHILADETLTPRTGALTLYGTLAF